MHPKFLAYLVVLCFQRRLPKQNFVARSKSKIWPIRKCWADYTTASRFAVSFYSRRVPHEKLVLIFSHPATLLLRTFAARVVFSRT